MATIKMSLDTRITTNGEHPIRFRLFNAGKSVYVYPGVTCEKKYYTGVMREPIKSRAVYASVRNALIREFVNKFDNLKFDLEREGKLRSMPVNDLREYLVGNDVVVSKKAKKIKHNNNSDFLDFFDKYGQSRNASSTKKHFSYVWGKLNDYCNSRGMRTILFCDIDYNFLVGLKMYILSTGVEETTRYKVESYIRAAYREAMRQGVVGRENDPFFFYKIEPVPQKEIESLSIETIQRLMSLDLTNQQGYDSLERTRNILFASFCMCGANLIDMYYMPAMHRQEAVFVRHKVQRRTCIPVHIYVEPELWRIISQYKGNEYMFMFQERYPSYTSFQRKMNERCSRLSELLGEKVNMQLIRRTYATVAGELDIPERTIDKGMGHTDQTVLRKYYAKFDWTKVRNANRKVLDHVMAGVVPNSIKVPKLIQRKSAAE